MSKAFYQNNPYLDHWKKELDDESINREVLEKLLAQGNYSKILDVGTGSGTQIRRDIELGLLKNNGEIIGIDINREGLLNSLASFSEWCSQKNYKLKPNKNPAAVHDFTIKNDSKSYRIKLFEGSVYDLPRENERFNLITGLSLVEHTDMIKSLSALYKTLENGGLLYLPVNYDEKTVFKPTNNAKVESKLMKLFNYAGIDQQFKGNVETGNSKCGSLLPSMCEKTDFEIISYGKSDWKIRKPYTNNKKEALSFFINAFKDVMLGASEQTKKEFEINDAQIKNWHATRTKQFENQQLIFECSNKDILCKK